MGQTDSPLIEDRWWNLAILLTTACTLGIVLVSLYFGYSVLFTHLFYIPIVLVAYCYPARGIYFASLLGLAYFASDVALNSPNAFYLSIGAGRVGMMIIVAWVVSALTSTLHTGRSATGRRSMPPGTAFSWSTAGSPRCSSTPGSSRGAKKSV